jgi:hypothetical protein
MAARDRMMAEEGFVRDQDVDIMEVDQTNGGRHSKVGANFMAIPPDAVWALAQIFERGADAHHDPDGSNWRKLSVEIHLNHALFHINAWQRGLVGEDHLGHAMCRLVMAFTAENGG